MKKNFKLDRIFNKIWKIFILKISIELTRIINSLFVDDSLLNFFKEFIILTLRKEDKENSFLLN